MKRDALLWFALIACPVIWFINLEASFAWAPLACSGRGKAVLYVLNAASFAVAMTVGILSWNLMQTARQQAKTEMSPLTSQRQAMAFGGIALSALFVLAIAAQAIPTLMMAACE